jgi:serine beta-lactamase-like protein LACTB, mitochondrial
MDGRGNMSTSRTPPWVSLILWGVVLVVLGIPGLFVYMGATAKKLHPTPGNIPSITSSPPPPKWAKAVEQARDLVRTSLAERNLPGLSVAVGIDRDIVWAEGFGFANLENSTPVTPDDRFRIGSASIVLMSAGVGVLLEEGRLKLDDEIQKYVPEFPAKQWPVTIRQVMGHIGGLPSEDTDNGVLTSSHCEQATDAVKLFAKDPVSQPGAEFQYSTFGWVLLSAVVESAADKPITAFLEEKVLRPLGMLDTFRESGRESGTGPVREATSYLTRFASNPTYGPRLLPKFDYSCYAGASGFLSTPSDLVRFGSAINAGKLLRRDTVQILQASQRTRSGKETGYGLGWDVKTVTLAGQQVRAVGNNGEFWNGMIASLLTFPERGMTVAVTSNINDADTSSLAESIAQVFAERGKSPGYK